MVRRSGITWGLAATVAVVVGGLSWIGWRLWMDTGAIPPPPPWVAGVVLLIAAGFVVWFGWAVRTYLKGRARRTLSPVRAARTLALAQAAILTGAAVLGWYAGQFLAVLPESGLQAFQDLLLPLAGGCVAGAVLGGAGFLVQSWCRVDPPSDDHEQNASRA